MTNKAEAKLRTQIFEKKYDLVERPECRFDKFVDNSFRPTKKLKKSYASIDSTCKALKNFFGKHFVSEIDTEMIRRYRQMRVQEKTRLDRKRSPLRVNKERKFRVLIRGTNQVIVFCSVSAELLGPRVSPFLICSLGQEWARTPHRRFITRLQPFIDQSIALVRLLIPE